MAFVPVRLSQRLTLGCVVLLILTALAVFAVMALRGQPRVVAASGELIEQTGSAIVRQLALQLARIEGVTASLAHLAEVLPREEPLYLNSLPNLIDSQGDKAIAGGASEILASGSGYSASPMIRWRPPIASSIDISRSAAVAFAMRSALRRPPGAQGPAGRRSRPMPNRIAPATGGRLPARYFRCGSGAAGQFVPVAIAAVKIHPWRTMSQRCRCRQP